MNPYREVLREPHRPASAGAFSPALGRVKSVFFARSDSALFFAKRESDRGVKNVVVFDANRSPFRRTI